MNGGNYLGFRELPYMQLVHGEHAFYSKNLRPDVLQRDLPWYGLKEDKGCAAD